MFLGRRIERGRLGVCDDGLVRSSWFLVHFPACLGKI